MARNYEQHPTAEIVYTVDLASRGWLQSGETVDTVSSVWTAETGMTILSQNWSANNTKANIKVKGLARELAYELTLPIVTNQRKIPKFIYIRVSDDVG